MRSKSCTLERANTARMWRLRRPSSSINTVWSGPSSARRMLLPACRPARSWRRWTKSWPCREQQESDKNQEERDNNHEKTKSSSKVGEGGDLPPNSSIYKEMIDD